MSDERQQMEKEIPGMNEARIDFGKQLLSLLAEGPKPPD
jgi:hypothetical protein